MTIILTISCKEGIIMFSDKRTSIEGKTHGIMDKIKRYNGFVVSFYGSVNLLEHACQLISDSDTLATASEKIFKMIKKINFTKGAPIDNSESGFHLSSFMNESPKIRHIFYRFSQKCKLLLKNENSNREKYDDYGSKKTFDTPRKYFFLINGYGNDLGYILLNEMNIDWSRTTFSEAVKIAREVFSKVFGHPSFKETCGDGMDYVKITPQIIEIVNHRDFLPASLPTEKIKYYEGRIIEHSRSLPLAASPSGLRIDL